jgi:4-diphosphocytidyl-2-C-methyl-D-erythritol kinase
MNTLRLPSYAKINLALFVKGKRGDGYHEIETIFQQISLHDEIQLKVTEAAEVEFSCNKAEIPTGITNLCVRAAYLLKLEGGVKSGVEIALQKNIPVSAGLGGGSSNAAVVLLGLNKLWKLNWPREKLRELAVKLGSDVPFFIEGGTALGEGRGEILRNLNFDWELPIVVVFPKVAIPTKWAYDELNLSLTIRKKYITLPHFKNINFNNVEFYQGFKNDFEGVVFKKYPDLLEIKSRLKESGAIYASLSGSGSSVFGIFDNGEAANAAKSAFERRYPVFVTQPVKWGLEQLS